MILVFKCKICGKMIKYDKFLKDDNYNYQILINNEKKYVGEIIESAPYCISCAINYRRKKLGLFII